MIFISNIYPPCRRNEYDGEEEFHITIRERGTREQEKEWCRTESTGKEKALYIRWFPFNGMPPSYKEIILGHPDLWKQTIWAKKNDYIYAIPMNGRFKTYIAHVVIFDFSGYGGSMALYMFQFA